MKIISLSILMLASLICFSQDGWKIKEGKITTTWSEKVDPANPLPDYPRPQMVRSKWMNLNGLWQYNIVPAAEETKPTSFAGQIVVPFAVESALSGVGKTVGKDNALWYERSVTIPSSFKNSNVLLQFGAVDWLCDVYVNDKKVGSHKGGYDPFSLDISSALTKSGKQKISIRVWDPSDDGPQPRGKQIKNPNGIWYTPVTGIWQTVWIEAVPKTYINATKQTPDLDKKTINISADVINFQTGDLLAVSAWKGTEKVAEFSSGDLKMPIALQIPDAELWSPSHPFLYDLKVKVVRKGKTVDEVTSYFAMRKISVAVDQKGIKRMMLNDQFGFQYGPLDQGWWPDGLYTAPTDEALRFDIDKTKEMGFNMIRKHVKVEPARWYNYCDKIGLLVWQDMPSGDMGNHWESRPGVFGLATDKNRTPESENDYRNEWKEIMNDLHNFPSIIVWVPFNEGWGQFKTKEIAKWTEDNDPSRLVNSASGGNFEKAGHIMDLHTYPVPGMPDPLLFGKDQTLVLGEFGGLGLPVTDHTWQTKDNWGYQSFKSPEELYNKYAEFIGKIPFLIESGLSAAVYTQTTDVEVETNGLITYDRKVIKMPVDKLAELHKKLYAVMVK